MTHQLFDEVIGTPPPSTVDVHALIRREKRALAVRRAGYGMTAVVVLAAAAVVVASPSDAPGSPPLTAQQRSTQDARFQLLANDKESGEASAKRLSQTFDGAVKRAVPGAKWATVKDFGHDPTADGLPLVVPIFADGPNMPARFFGGSGIVAVDTHQGVLAIMVFPQIKPGEKTDKTGPALKCAGEPGCVETAGPNGEKLVTITTNYGSFAWQEVRVGVAGDRLLTISLSNLDGMGQSYTPPLTAAQLGAIAIETAGQIKT